MSSSPDKENSQISKIEIDANETTEKDVTSVDIQQNLGGSESTVPIDKLDCKLLNMSESVQMENRNSDSQSNIDQQGTSQLEDSQDTDDSETPQASASPREPAADRWGSRTNSNADSLIEDLDRLHARIDEMLAGGNLVIQDELDDDDFDFEELANAGYPIGELPPPLYPMGPLKYVECVVCFEKKDLNLRTCCAAPVCDACVLYYLDVQVEQGIVKIVCPNNDCDKYVHRDEVMTRLTGEIKEKYYRFLTDANKDPHVKTCPRCSVITKIEPSKLQQHNVKKYGLRHRCEDCELVWCFPCQAPWHEGITCKGFNKGDKMVKKWAKEQHRGQVNAQKCPKCKILIQRSSGCDHMTCNRCKVHFCYRCGERHIRVKFLGDHYSRLSIFGCKYKFLPDKPVRRKLIRGSIFALKALLAPVVVAGALGVCVCCLGVAVFVLPFWGIHKLRKWAQEKKRRKEERQYREMWRQRLQEIRVTGDPYIANFNRLRDLGQNPYMHSGRSSQRNHGTLLVDELDMRQRNSTISSTASDNVSIRSLNDDHIRYIELNMNNLDIHHSNTNNPDLEISNRGQIDQFSSGLVLRPGDLLTEKNDNGKSNTKSKSRELGKAATSVEVHVNDRQKVTGSLRDVGQSEVTNEKPEEPADVHSSDSHSKCESTGHLEQHHQSKTTECNTQSKDLPSHEGSNKDSQEKNAKNVGDEDEENNSASDGEVMVKSTGASKSKKNDLKGDLGMNKVMSTSQKAVNKPGDSKVKRLVSQYSCSLRTNGDEEEEEDNEVKDHTDIVEECSKNLNNAVIIGLSTKSKKEVSKLGNVPGDNNSSKGLMKVNGIVVAKVKDVHANVKDIQPEKEDMDCKFSTPGNLTLTMNDSGVYV